jgi:hypothetical protein
MVVARTKMDLVAVAVVAASSARDTCPDQTRSVVTAGLPPCRQAQTDERSAGVLVVVGQRVSRLACSVALHSSPPRNRLSRETAARWGLAGVWSTATSWFSGGPELRDANLDPTIFGDRGPLALMFSQTQRPDDLATELRSGDREGPSIHDPSREYERKIAASCAPRSTEAPAVAQRRAATSPHHHACILNSIR